MHTKNVCVCLITFFTLRVETNQHKNAVHEDPGRTPLQCYFSTPTSKRVLDGAVKRNRAINIIDCRRDPATNLAHKPLPFRSRGP